MSFYLLNHLINIKISKYLKFHSLILNTSFESKRIKILHPLKFPTAEEKDKCRGFSSMSREQEVKYRSHG